MNFRELGICEELVQAAADLGFETPMPIQEKAIPVLVSGARDFVGLAQTGTGKTGAFGLPLLQRIDASVPTPQGIIICPTRELCLQITDDLIKFATHFKKIRITPVYGGAGIVGQIRSLKSGSHIIVATPGRLIDLMERKVVELSEISTVVLDEADEMLNMGFQEDIDRILESIPENRNIWLFSATMPQSVAAIARNYLDDPMEISVGRKNSGAENIRHFCYMVQEKHRYESLRRILDYQKDIFALVFCRTRIETQTVAENLMRDGHQAEALHGDLSQSQRDYVMRKFRRGSVRVLVATDVAARGIDVDDITHVIHYRMPDDVEVYTHRSGRTARAGKSGASVVLANVREKRRLRELERRGKFNFDLKKIPDGTDICKNQLFGFVERIIQSDVAEDGLDAYLEDIVDTFEDFDREELIRRFVSAEFRRLFADYRHAGDINVKKKQERAASDRKFRKDKGAAARERLKGKKTQRFFINVGRMDKINEGAIIRLICSNSGIRSGMIGKIDLNREFSFFEVEQRAADVVWNTVNKSKLDGRTVEIRQVTEKKKQGKTKRRTY